VRFIDQQKINEFGKLNNRLLEIRADSKQYKEDIEKLEDAVAELMMASDGTFMIMIGESFVESSPEYANECII
jgi:prefoldin subunit 4